MKYTPKQELNAAGSNVFSSKSRISITFMKGKQEKFNDYGDIDDQIIEFSPSVLIKNSELTKDYTDIKGEYVMIGRNVIEKDAYAILQRKEFKFNIPARSERKLKEETFNVDMILIMVALSIQVML